MSLDNEDPDLDDKLEHILVLDHNRVLVNGLVLENYCILEHNVVLDDIVCLEYSMDYVLDCNEVLGDSLVQGYTVV